MIVEYAKLPPLRDGLTSVKCFYKHSGKYGEFYLHVDSLTHTIEFTSKEGAYTDVLAEAFAEAMRKV